MLEVVIDSISNEGLKVKTREVRNGGSSGRLKMYKESTRQEVALHVDNVSRAGRRLFTKGKQATKTI